MEGVAVPIHLDAPKRMLFWTVDQVVPFALLFMVGMMAGRLFFGIVAGCVFSWSIQRFKNARSDGLMQHFAYWYGVAPLKGRSIINPFIRRIFPA